MEKFNHFLHWGYIGVKWKILNQLKIFIHTSYPADKGFTKQKVKKKLQLENRQK